MLPQSAGRTCETSFDKPSIRNQDEVTLILGYTLRKGSECWEQVRRAASVMGHARHSLEGYWELLTLPCQISPTKLFITGTRHILAGSFELARYYTRAVDGDVVPEVIDTVACFAQAFTTLRLSKTLLRGDVTTRPSYQAPALMRPFIGCLAALVYQSPCAIHRASVKLLHAFLYTRMIIFLAKRFGVGKIHSNATIYAHAVFLGAIIAIHDSGLHAGVPVYISMVGAVMVLNRYVADRLTRCVTLNDPLPMQKPNAVDSSWTSKVSMPIWERNLMRVLLWLGLANLEAIKEHDRSSKLSCPVNDEYVQEGL
ncbi:hypothetical protein MRS44_018534 [Fusarium solani]|uniref:uncharacterized protein n=1 Tax=Fusarium solani TaxID=169388 RepID=UPI0032C4AF0F|nr:hypothetical protein MRS44_018534 [Fusarium solani]